MHDLGIGKCYLSVMLLSLGGPIPCLNGLYYKFKAKGTVSGSLVLPVEVFEIRKFSEHFAETDVVPLFGLFAAELGKDLREVLVLTGDHVLSAFGDVDIDFLMGEQVPLKQSFFQELSAMIGNRGFVLSIPICTAC